MKFISARTFTVLSLLLLAACGGGGGGGAPAPAPSLPTAVVITETNAKPVAADAFDAVQDGSASQGGDLLTGVQVQSESTGAQSQFRAMAEATRLAVTSLGRVAGRPALPTGVAISETGACDLGGTLTITGNIASDAGLFAGDKLTLIANNCAMFVDGVRSTLNGRMDMTILSGGIGATLPFRVVISVVTTNLSVQSGTTTVVASGDTNMDWTASSITESIVSTGVSMSTRVTTGATTRTFTLKNYTQSTSTTGVSVSNSLSAIVETNSTRLGASGGSYTITTPTPVVLNSSTKIFSAGVIKVVGAANSQLLITVGSNSAVTLQLDANGDGTFERTISSTVSELRALL